MIERFTVSSVVVLVLIEFVQSKDIVASVEKTIESFRESHNLTDSEVETLRQEVLDQIPADLGELE